MNISPQKGYIIIQLPPHLSADTIEHYQAELKDPEHPVNEMLAKQKEAKFVLDLEKVTNLYSIGIRLIAFLQKHITDAGGKVFFVNANEAVGLVLRTSGMDQLIPVYDTILDFELEFGETEE